MAKAQIFSASGLKFFWNTYLRMPKIQIMRLWLSLEATNCLLLAMPNISRA
jgi:hypothetical protein